MGENVNIISEQRYWKGETMQQKRVALIPAYQPEPVLVQITKELWKEKFDIVVINDGSDTQYDTVFRDVSRYGKVLEHGVNRGKGAALRTGFEYIRKQYCEDVIVVTMDADGQHRVKDAVRLCAVLEEQPGGMVLGSRKLDKSAPIRSKFGNTLTRFVYRIATGVSVYDTQTGLRAFGSELLEKLCSIEGERYEYEMNVLLTLAQKKIPIREINIEVVYINDNAGSHFNAIRDSAKIYAEIIKFSLASLSSFFVDYILYLLLSLVTGSWNVTASIWLSNITARVCSATLNFHLNRKFVFQKQESKLQDAVRYGLLAVGILVGNTVVLNLLTEIWMMNRYLAKLLTEILFFTLSFLVQRIWIFRREEKE